MEPSLDSSFGSWMSKVCNKLLCNLGQWAKSDALYKPSEIALITGYGLLWTTTTGQSLPSTSFPIPFSNLPYIRNRKSNLSAIYYADWPASIISTIVFRCRSDNIVVYTIKVIVTTMCLNKEEPIFYCLMTVCYITVPVYSTGSRLYAWSLACVSPVLIQK